MKKSKALLLSLLILTTLIFQSCKPDEPDLPDNPLNGKTTAIFNPDLEYGTMSDIEGNIYKTIQIGDQIWMAENLRTTKYKNGEGIATTFSNELWGTTDVGLYCNYNNTEDLDSIATYGRLYNWYAVNDSRSLAPEGWRVPSANDWNILIDYLGGETNASRAMKETGTFHWDYDPGNNNLSGFTSLPSGRRYLSNDFSGISIYSTFWTSSDYSEASAGFLYLYYGDYKVYKGVNLKNNGYAVRCIKE